VPINEIEDAGGSGGCAGLYNYGGGGNGWYGDHAGGNRNIRSSSVLTYYANNGNLGQHLNSSGGGGAGSASSGASGFGGFL